MNSLFGLFARKADYGGIEYWNQPERSGWLMKQGEVVKSWRRRWFVMKGGRIFWFLNEHVTPDSVPRGVIDVTKCLSIKGAEDTINKPCAFELATPDSMFFIADTDKEKEDWINSIGRAIVKHSRSMIDNDRADYTTR